ncbi:hypothetical protein [Demetria terragena]|uniref:hypothetical protein n=1 Tax=Demetria terragena TaxID=63959 RepID=UPI000376545E|nr:hypothetical protein [Demetria terragena]
MGSPPIGQRREILARAERGAIARRQADVDDLELLLIWADSHDQDPQAEPGAVPARRGGPRLVTVGGAGTPQVMDLCFAEMAIARQTGEAATRNSTADALDLRHRLPKVWSQVHSLRCEVWVARKIARMTRPLSRDAVAIVDRAVAEAIDQSPSRLLSLAEAKIIESDQAAHHERIRENQSKVGVWFPKPLPGSEVDQFDNTAGIRTVFARLDPGEAADLEQAVDDLAGLLAERGDFAAEEQLTWDQLRARGLSLLARPADALALMSGDNGKSQTTRRSATVVVHLTDTTVTGDQPGIARVEALGPMLIDHLAGLVGHRNIEMLPVVDLRESRAVNGYEHPADVRTRGELRTCGDVFPHSGSRPDARVDHDHAVPYDHTGPPGQTGDHNDAPLTRRHHRAKTHLNYQVDQPRPGVYRWTTPHGLERVVTPRGTVRASFLRTEDGAIKGERYPDLPPLDKPY